MPRLVEIGDGSIALGLAEGRDHRSAGKQTGSSVTTLEPVDG